MTLKKLFFLLCIAICCFINGVAKETVDSCYVYGYLWWWPSATKYSAKIDLGPKKENLTDIVDSEGQKLVFSSFLNAVNYLSLNGWEIIEISQKNPENTSFKLQQYALIKKLMPINEAQTYATPKE